MSRYAERRGRVTALEGQELLWVGADELGAYDMPPADEPLKSALRDLL